MNLSKRLAPWIASGFLSAMYSAHAMAAPAFQAIGKGVQIYVCQASGATFAWKLQGPEAELSGSDGQTIGKHFAGPTWQAEDGSTIVGEPMVSSSSPQEGAVPWLVLHTRSTAGPGRFASVSYVTRTFTQGGAAPPMGCDAAHAGAQIRAPYSATYTFFTDANSASH